MKIRTLIVDDEPLARVRMNSMLAEYADDFDIVGEAGSASQAVEQIKALHPDLVFLDIQMPDKDAFEMLPEVADEDFAIVFTTAYDEYALKSFEFDVIDYLLKPIAEERLEKTVEKIRNYFPSESESSLPADFSLEKLASLMAKNSKQYMQRVQVKLGNRTLLLSLDEVIRFKSEDKYTIVYTTNSQYVIDTPLVELEENLDPQQFVRVHRAHLVAIDYIAEIQKVDAGRISVVLRDKARTSITVSRNFVKSVRSL